MIVLKVMSLGYISFVQFFWKILLEYVSEAYIFSR